MDFTTHKAVSIHTGENCVAENAALFGSLGRRALIVSGRRSADLCGALTDVTDALTSVGATWVRYNVIPENPPAPLCHEGGRLAREEGCDFVIAIGGGSAIDAAKAIAAYAANPSCDVMDLFDAEKRTADGLPLIAIPTTAGTGSEACRYSVLTIEDGRRKKTFSSPSAYAKHAFVSAKYTATLDENYTVSTALDALAHAIESYLSPKSTVASEEAALYAAREIWNVLTASPSDETEERDAGGYTKKQRQALQNAACAAGIAIDYTGTGFPHPLGYSLTLTRGIPHGRACAIFEGAYLRYNMLTSVGRERIVTLASHLQTTPEKMMERIPAMSGVHLHIGAEEREELIDRVAGAGNYANSPYVITRGEMSDIYKRLFE
ncbi:MAG: iron-containing alcohol dehydrogenase [Eubacteriales bacterium]